MSNLGIVSYRPSRSGVASEISGPDEFYPQITTSSNRRDLFASWANRTDQSESGARMVRIVRLNP